VTIYILIPLLLIPQILLCGVIVKFDDLQDKTADKDAVPIVGELMVSRWAFEALAVEQYAGNRYMATFFENEKKSAQARFRADLLTTELVGRIDYLSGQINIGRPATELASGLAIIRNEIKKLDKEGPQAPLAMVDSLVPQKFNDRVGAAAKAHLLEIQHYYKNQKDSLRNQKDRIVLNLNKQQGKDYLFNLKQKYHNLAIEDLVLNTNTKEYFRETKSGLMQKVAPVYKAPDFNTGRAHFLTSEKRILSLEVSTLWFNIVIIWLMSLFLYTALYFNWLRKLINGVSGIFGK
jgi:hypothetical protein